VTLKVLYGMFNYNNKPVDFRKLMRNIFCIPPHNKFWVLLSLYRRTAWCSRAEICLCILIIRDGLKSNLIALLSSQRQETCSSDTLFHSTV